MRVIADALHWLGRRVSDEGGFTMVTVSGALLVVMMTSAVALSAAQGDFGLGKDDRDSKQAYAAAEAGVHDYLYHLNTDNSYWAKCNNVGAPHVGQRWNGSGNDPRGWKNLPQPAGDARIGTVQYTIELLPANGNGVCDHANAQGSMIDNQTGTFRIRSTGRVRRNDGTWEKRSIIAQFRRRGFLDYLYFTDYETSDPAWYELYTQGYATNPDLVTWASENCARYWRDGRGTRYYYDPDGNFQQDGQWFRNGSWSTAPWVLCTSIRFADGDKIQGPLHTNDDILVCGDPDFGRSPADAIEVSAPAPGWRSSCNGSAPDFIGQWKPNAPVISMPPSNTKLKNVAEADYRFTGTTIITLSGTNIVVTNPSMGLSNVTMSFPSNGVIYVSSGACGQGYKPLSPYSAPSGCGDVYVRGSYAKDLTIASEKDIVIFGDTRRNGDKMLGLIANNFVRIFKPASNLNAANRTCSNASGTMTNVTVDAAILALQHSFTVDHYFCGNPLSTLRVFGAIAQKFRGPVGTGGSSGISTGYLKDYEYDDRLRLRQPPHFLDPVQSAWRLMRQWEQVPAL